MYRPERRDRWAWKMLGLELAVTIRLGSMLQERFIVRFVSFWKLNDLSIAFCERERIVVDFRSLATGLPFDCSRLAYYVV